jgi:hypothetical protein
MTAEFCRQAADKEIWRSDNPESGSAERRQLAKRDRGCAR